MFKLIKKYLELLDNNRDYPVEFERFKENAAALFADGFFDDKERVVWLFKFDEKLPRNKFYRIKRWVKILYQAFEEDGLIRPQTREYADNIMLSDIDIQDEISCFFFRDLDSILSFIDEVTRSYVGPDYKECCMDIRSMVILAWHGFETSDMSVAKKSSIRVADGEVVIGDKKVSIEKKYLTILSAYADSVDYIGIGGRKYEYPESNKLFRSRLSGDRDENSLYIAVSYFNSAASEKFAHNIRMQSIQTNRLFYQMHSDGVLPDDMEAFAKYYTEGEKKIYFTQVLYQKWVETYCDD